MIVTHALAFLPPRFAGRIMEEKLDQIGEGPHLTEFLTLDVDWKAYARDLKHLSRGHLYTT